MPPSRAPDWTDPAEPPAPVNKPATITRGTASVAFDHNPEP
jgi:hypothetical protein